MNTALIIALILSTDVAFACTLSQVVNGVFQARTTCDQAFSSLNFNLAPDYTIYDQKVYVKNNETHIFELYQPIPIPQTKFPGLVSSVQYDNFTCENRCCKAVNVFKDPKTDIRCSSDWSVCANPKKDDSIRCNNKWTPNCISWVPCNANNDVNILSILLFAISFIPAFWPFFFWMYSVVDANEKFGIKQFDYWSILLRILFVPFIVTAWLSLSIVSNYDYWVSKTETNHDYLAYENCVDHCNRMTWDLYVILERFCEDTRSVYYSTNSANQNTFLSPNADCSLLDGYCRTCYGKYDAWNNARFVIEILRIRSMSLWAAYIAAFFLSFILNMSKRTDYVILVCQRIFLFTFMAFKFVAFAFDANVLALMNAETNNIINQASNSQNIVTGLFISFVLFDLMETVIIFFWFFTILEYDPSKDENITRSTDSARRMAFMEVKYYTLPTLKDQLRDDIIKKAFGKKNWELTDNQNE
jgi:hypothetical protein